MTTREEYEHAARAAGLEIGFTDSPKDGVYKLVNNELDGWWRPLDDDGDSRRLEVACFMRVVIGAVSVMAACSENKIYMHKRLGTDPCAATRLAVFRCAVEIGKRLMKGGE